MSDQKFYDDVASELQNRSIRTGLWARAVAEVGSEGPAARARYIQLRVSELEREEEARRRSAERHSREAEATNVQQNSGADNLDLWAGVGVILGLVLMYVLGILHL